jgi:DNA primase
MNDLQIIKKRIFEEGKIPTILSGLGCDNIRTEQGGKIFTAQLPPRFLSKNKRTIQIKNTKTLVSNVRSRGFEGDVFGLVSFLCHEKTDEIDILADLSNAKMWLIETLGYFDLVDGRYKEKKQQNSWLKEIKQKRGCNHRFCSITENTILNENKVKKKYRMYPYQGWIDEGITYKTQIEFEVGFDLWSNRIVFMIHNKNGQLIGVKGRYVGNDIEILEDKKYIYLHQMNKSIELFNLHRAIPYILEQKQIIVFEGAKSCMLAWQNGFKNTVSIEGDKITDVQISLIKELGLDIEIIVAFDKDKMKAKCEEFSIVPSIIVKECKKFSNRSVYALLDKNNLLIDKDSPLDKGENVFKTLLSDKVRVEVENIFKLA